MGVSERRQREKALRRECILDTALALAVEDGWDSVTTRRIADRLEYSPAMLYEYFPGKRDILNGVARKGFGRLAEILQACLDGQADHPMLAMAQQAADFAFAHRRLYELMHTADVFEFGSQETPIEARTCFALLWQAIENEVGSRDDLDDLTDMAWSAISGLISLALFRRLAGGEYRARRLVGPMVESLIRGWRDGD